MENILSRIKQFCEYQRITITALEQKIGASKGVLSRALANNTDIQSKWLVSLVENYPLINNIWLLTGKGSMLLDQEDKLISERINTFSLQLNKEESYPIFSVEAAAGFGSENFSIEKSDVVDYCSIPIFKGRKVDFMVPVRGQSMLPKYKTGDLVACKIISDNTFIQWNEIHVIATREQGILLKRLRKSKIENHLIAISDNPEYEPFDIPHEEITGIALVIGGVSLE